MKNKYSVLSLAVIIVLIILSEYYIPTNRTKVEEVNLYKYNIENNKDKIILIEVDKKTLSVVDNNYQYIISTYPIASGKSYSPTPLGSFKIIQKAAWGEGFGSRWLGLDVPWGKYGIHGTNNPRSIGSNVSAGCIRMRNSDIEDLYDRVNIDTKVIIINGDFGPFGNGFRTLKPGDRGADVLEVQKRLNQEGFYLSTFDGIYGEGMKRALLDFLRYKDIPLTDKINEEIYKELRIILMD